MFPDNQKEIVKKAIISTKKYFAKERELGVYILSLGCVYFTQSEFSWLVTAADIPDAPMWLLLSSSLLVAVCYLCRYKFVFDVIYTIFTLLLYANLIYYRTYASMIPFESYGIKFSDLISLFDSALSLMRSRDVNLFIPLLVNILIGGLWGRSFFLRSAKLQKFALIHLAVVVVVCAVTILPNHKRVKDTFNEAFGYDRKRGVGVYGFPGHLCYECANRNQYVELNEEDRLEIARFLAKNRGDIAIKQAAVEQKNVILIIVESFEAFVLGKTIEGHEITPFLNALIDNPKSFTASHVVSQVDGGRSSDGQLIINTGLLPIRVDPTCFLTDRKYYSLASELKEGNNYEDCVTILSHPSTLWNQQVINLQFSYNGLCSISEMGAKEEEVFGLGLTDLVLSDKAMRVIDTLRQPYFAQIVTSTSHAPFEILESMKAFTISDCYPRSLGAYAEVINYTDRAIAKFVNVLEDSGKLENSTIIITSDHSAFSDEMREEMRANEMAAQLLDNYSYMPLIIYNGAQAGRYDNVMGQIDIYPTLVDLLGINTEWRGVGESVMGKRAPKSAVDKHQNLIGVDNEMVEYQQKSWYISDKIIRGNYFLQ